MTDKFTKLHNEFVAAATKVQAALNEMNVSSFLLEIHASGRTSGTKRDPVLITYVVGEQYEEPTKGARLGPVLDEYLRRHGWNKKNAPQALPYYGQDDNE